MSGGEAAIAAAVEAVHATASARAPAAQQVSALLQLGEILDSYGQSKRATRAFAQAVRLAPSSHEAYYTLGVSLGRDKRATPAIDAFRISCALAPSHAESYRALAIAATMLHRTSEAAHALRTALHIRPSFDAAAFDLGVALQQQRRDNEAIAVYDGLLSRTSDHAAALTNRGTALKDQGRAAEAATSYERALRVAPQMVEVYNNLAVLTAGDLREPERALRLISVGRSLASASSMASSLEWASAEGLALTQLRRFGEAATAFDSAAHAQPASSDAICHLVLARMRIGLWQDSDEHLDRALSNLNAGECTQSWDPLYGLAMPRLRPLLLKSLANQFAARKARLYEPARHALGPITWSPYTLRGVGRPLRVGYLSADFRWHVMAFLTLGLVKEAAQTEGFDVYALSLARKDGSEWQARFRSAIGSPHHFVDLSGSRHGAIRETDALSIAKAISALQLDILVDLNGYTTDERSEVLALNLARVSMHAVGYPGTMASRGVPYMLLDPTAMPPRPRHVLQERLVLQPHCYQVNDHAQVHLRLPTPSYVDTMAHINGKEGFKSSGPVIVNFNQIYKISPTAGALWCSMLLQEPTAMLWLLKQPADGEPNLRSEFAACGVANRRVRFAPLIHDIPVHLRRTARASLVADTPEYNCHTTGSDALWSGVPIVTVPGDSMASRVAQSLLKSSATIPGIVRSLREYVEVGAHLLHQDLRWADEAQRIWG